MVAMSVETILEAVEATVATEMLPTLVAPTGSVVDVVDYMLVATVIAVAAAREVTLMLVAEVAVLSNMVSA